MGRTPQLTEERMGQIALTILKKDMETKQIVLSKSDVKRKLGVVYSQLKDEGITKKELDQLHRYLLLSAVRKMLAPDSK